MYDGCDEVEVVAFVEVFVRTSGDDAFSGSSWRPKRTFLGGLLRIKELAASFPPNFRFVLDMGPGTFDLPAQTPMTEALTLISIDHFVLRGAGADQTVLRAPGGDGTWALRFADATGVRLRDFRLTFGPMCTRRTSGIDLQRVQDARVVGVTIDPIPYYGLRSYGGDDPNAPRARCLRVERCRFNRQPVVGCNEHPEAVLIADGDGVHVTDCVFEDIEENALGFWRAVSRATVTGCTFEQCRVGLYFGRSVLDLSITGCSFTADTGAQGANLADSEDEDPLSVAPTPGPARVIVVRSCTFRSRVGGAGNAVALVDAHSVVVVGCTFDRYAAIPIVLGASGRPPAAIVSLVDNRVTWFDGPLDDAWAARPVIRIQNAGLAPAPIHLRVDGLCAGFVAAPTPEDSYRTIVSVDLPAAPDPDLNGAALAVWAALDVTLTGVTACGPGQWNVFLWSAVFAGSNPQNFGDVFDPSCTC